MTSFLRRTVLTPDAGHELPEAGVLSRTLEACLARKPGVDFALNTETLIVRKVQMNHIQFDGRHRVESSFQAFKGHEVTHAIYQESTPGKTWRILDRDSGESKGITVGNLENFLGNYWRPNFTFPPKQENC